MNRRLTIASFALLVCVSGCGGGGNLSTSTLPAQTGPTAAPSNSGPVPAPTPASSKIQEFPITPRDSGPTAIAVARDATPWFLTANALNHLAASGTVAQFTLTPFDRYNSGTDIILGLDGNLYFTANCGPTESDVFCQDLDANVKLLRSTPSGSLTMLQTAGDTREGTFQSALVNGGSNTIWAAIGRGDTTGQNGSGYEEFRYDGSIVVPSQHLPQPCGVFGSALYYTANGIARGGDGAVYIAASSPCGEFDVPGAVSVVLRIDLSGTLTNTFAVPDANRIAQGPDGNLWVTQNGVTNAIGRLTTSGALTEYPLPTPNAGPMGITLGNDGALWFTQLNASKIGRITGDGKITEYDTPTNGSGPYGIASLAGECGPGHGDIWFTEFKANKIGRMLF